MRSAIPTILAAPAPIVLSLIAGCSSPEPRADYDSDLPEERSLALAESYRSVSDEDLDDIISQLDSDDPAIRMLAQRVLFEHTGETMGYHYADPEPQRDEAVGRWVAWRRGE